MIYTCFCCQDKGAHIIIGTFHHSRAKEVFCQVGNSKRFYPFSMKNFFQTTKK